jgi:hypothetical protein
MNEWGMEWHWKSLSTESAMKVKIECSTKFPWEKPCGPARILDFIAVHPHPTQLNSTPLVLKRLIMFGATLLVDNYLRAG